MKGRLDNHKGLAIFETIGAIAIIVVIGVVGWALYKHQYRDNLMPVDVATRGWKTYTLKDENATFKYPASWKVNFLSNDDSGYTVSLGSKDFNVEIDGGSFSGLSSCFPPQVMGASRLTFDGHTGYLIYESVGTCSGGGSDGNINMVHLSADPTSDDPFDSKDPKLPKQGPSSDPMSERNELIISAAYTGGDETLAQAKKDGNYQAVMYLIESFRYH